MPLPQNSEETAYVSFALVEALIDGLVARDILTRGDADGIFQNAVALLGQGSVLVEHSNKGPRARAADFIRDAMLIKKNLG
jgi:hypothetical protein